MIAHEKRTLKERLEWIADWSEPDIDLADAGTAREALDRIEALERQVDFRAAVAYDCGHTAGWNAALDAALKAFQAAAYDPAPFTRGKALLQALRKEGAD